MTDQEWAQSFARCLGVYFFGEAMDERDGRGRPIKDDNLLLLFNSHHEAIPFKLPVICKDCQWSSILDTSFAGGLKVDGTFKGGAIYSLAGRSLALLKQEAPL